MKMPSADENTLCWEVGGRRTGAGEKERNERRWGREAEKERRERGRIYIYMEEDGEEARKEERERKVKRYKNVKSYLAAYLQQC